MTNDPTTRCPHCGAGVNAVIGAMFNCGNPFAFGTPLRRTIYCEEREARQKAEDEVARLNRIIEWSADIVAAKGMELTARQIRNEVINPSHFKP